MSMWERSVDYVRYMLNLQCEWKEVNNRTIALYQNYKVYSLVYNALSNTKNSDLQEYNVKKRWFQILNAVN